LQGEIWVLRAPLTVVLCCYKHCRSELWRENLPQQTLVIHPAPPFDFDLTARYHASYRSYFGNVEFQNGTYRQVIESEEGVYLALVRSVGSIDSPQLEVTLERAPTGSSVAAIAAERVAWALGTRTRLKEFYAMAEADPALGTYTRQLHGLHPTHTYSIFEAIVVAITGQQIAAGVARTIRSLLVQEYGRHVTIDGQDYHLFPTPQALKSAGVEELRKMKLSTRKAEYISDFASKVASGELHLEALHDLEDDEVEGQLIQLRGIGKWTVQWLQVVAMDRHDAFPSGDLALRRFVSFLYLERQPIDEALVEEFSRRWYPYRSLVTVYLFAAARMGLLKT